MRADLGKDAWCSPSGRCSGRGGDALGPGGPWEGRGSAAGAAWGPTPGRQQGRELETAAWSAPRAGRIGINPARGRGCSFRRVAVCREHLGAWAWGPHGVQGWARCSPGSCPSLAPPRTCREGSSNSLLSRPEFHPSKAGRSRCGSVQCFEALSSRGESLSSEHLNSPFSEPRRHFLKQPALLHPPQNLSSATAALAHTTGCSARLSAPINLCFLLYCFSFFPSKPLKEPIEQ